LSVDRHRKMSVGGSVEGVVVAPFQAVASSVSGRLRASRRPLSL
jgi:hypothetical protein